LILGPIFNKFDTTMAIKITDQCINCGLCEQKCPNNAIYEGGHTWSFLYGTKESKFKKNDGSIVSNGEAQSPLANDFYYIAPEKCTECVGFHNEPQCVAVCPVDCCLPDENNVESKDYLEVKKETVRIS
jgi:ferredoxin